MDYQEVKKNLDIDEIDRLNLDTNEAAWDNQARTHNPQAIGSTAITSPNAVSTLPDITSDLPEMTPSLPNAIPTSSEQTNLIREQNSSAAELGQVVPSMPPGYEIQPAANVQPDNHAESQTKHPDPKLFSHHYAMAGDRLSNKTIDALQDREKQLSADGDIASFVDFIDNARDEFQGREVA